MRKFFWARVRPGPGAGQALQGAARAAEAFRAGANRSRPGGWIWMETGRLAEGGPCGMLKCTQSRAPQGFTGP